jgi:signal transduction histidine kinase
MAKDDNNSRNFETRWVMSSRRTWGGGITRPTVGITDLGWGDIALAVLLSVFAMLIVTHGRSGGHVLDAGLAGALAVLLMTLPVAFARRRPLVVAGVLVAGALINWGAVGHYVRCGSTLPAVFYVAFVVGSRCRGRDRVIGEMLVIGSILVQCASDPQLYPISNAVVFIPISLAFLGAGHLLHRRNVTVEALHARTLELHAQRERNAHLAVEADRARIAGELDEYLHAQVHDIAAAAASGREALGAGPDEAAAAFVSIQGTGRETLAHMREVVGSLREEAPMGPQPVLAQLGRLLDRDGKHDVRLQVTGDPRLLPPGLELSGYRIVEHLLGTLEESPESEARVEVVFGVDALELKVVGPSGRESTVRPALAAATERAHLHGGTLRSSTRDGLRETLVLIPLTAGAV